MIRRFVLGGLAAALCAAALPAAPFRPAPFQSLRGEVRQRIESDYSGTLDAAQKKELKTLQKSLQTIDKTSKNFGVDLKNAGKLAKGLEKAFPDEFAGPAVGQNIRLVLDQLFSDLHALVAGDLDDQEGRDDALSEQGAAKVDALQERARAAIESGLGTAYADWAKALILGYKSWLKGEKIIAKDKGPGGSGGGGKEFLKATIAGAKWESDASTRSAVVTGQLVVIAGTKLGLPAKILNITPQAVTGAGTYTISIASYTEAGLPTKSYQVTNAGTITFTTFDTVNLRIAGTFSFTAAGTLGTPGNVDVTGSFDIKYVNGGI